MTNSKLITELTPEQEAQLDVYFVEGVRIGTAAGSDFDEALVRDLTDKHRVICGIAAATEFRIYDSPAQAIRELGHTGLSEANALYGQHDAGWLIYYAYYREVLGFVEETKDLIYLTELAKHVGWMWMSSDTTIVTRRPKYVHLRPASQPGFEKLHNEDGAAIEYADGLKLYYLNDVFIPDEFSWLCTTPRKQLKPEQILGISNTEVRTEGMKKLGLEFFLSNLNSRKLDTYISKLGGNYELLQVEIGGNSRIYLKMNCPSSSKFHLEAVHPDCRTCRQALKWREEGVLMGNYEEPKART